MKTSYSDGDEQREDDEKIGESFFSHFHYLLNLSSSNAVLKVKDPKP